MSNQQAKVRSNNPQEDKKNEKIPMPQLLALILRRSPPQISRDGWRGYVNQPGSPYNNMLVLFPRDGVNMNLLPHQVAFVAVTDILTKQTRGGTDYLYGTPVGERSFADLNSGHDQAKAIIRNDIETFLAHRATARSANKAFEDLDKMDKIPFVTPNDSHFPLSGFDLAIGQANIEKISAFMDSFIHIQKPQPLVGINIGGRLTLAGRHDAVLCVAPLEAAAMAAAYLVSLGWWVVSAYLNPEQTQWAFVMTSTPQAAWDYIPQARQQPVQKDRRPQREPAPAKPHVPAVARQKPTAVLNGLGALEEVSILTQAPEVAVASVALAAPVAMVAEVVVDEEAPVAPETHETSFALTVVPPAMPSFTAQQPISEEEMTEVMEYIGTVDSEVVDLLIIGLCQMSQYKIGNLHLSTVSVIEDKLRPEVAATITEAQQEAVGKSIIPMLLQATPGWIAALAAEIADIQEEIEVPA